MRWQACALREVNKHRNGFLRPPKTVFLGQEHEIFFSAVLPDMVALNKFLSAFLVPVSKKAYQHIGYKWLDLAYWGIRVASFDPDNGGNMVTHHFGSQREGQAVR